jgi:predicted PurR-regulated permease PerM
MTARCSNTWQRLLFTVGSIVLVVVALYLARAVLIPLVLAMLLSLVLSPLVGALERIGLGRIPSVVGAVLLAFCLIGGIGLGVAVQLQNLAADLPQHEREIEEKIERIREAGRRSTMVDIYDMMRGISRKIQGTGTAAGGSREEPVPVIIETSSFPVLQSVAGPVLEVLLTAGMTIILLMFMLIGREDLRNRVIRLWSESSITSMTKAFDDAVRRISRFLLVQLAINATYGLALTIGLYAIGVPYAFLWGFLAGTLRYIPYIGTWIGALLPIALSIAVLPGWSRPLLVLGLFLFLELITYNVAEPLLFGQSIGVSATALLIAAAFWAWLWGPIGLVIATPLTACLAVLGRYVPNLEFFGILLGDEPALAPHLVYYQRLLAKDQDEAMDIVEEFLQTQPPLEVYDRLLVPALVVTKENRERGEFTAKDEQFIIEVTREVVDDLVLPNASSNGRKQESAPHSDEPAENRVLMFGCPARDEIDELSLSMFRHLVEPSKCRFEIISHKQLTAEVLAHVQQDQPEAVCIACVPPRGLTHTRYLCKRLRAQLPDLKILVGCWGLEPNSDRTRERLLAAGANKVGSRLLETRDQLIPFIQLHAHMQQSNRSGCRQAPGAGSASVAEKKTATSEKRRLNVRS